MKIRTVANGGNGNTPARSLFQQIQARPMPAATKPVPVPTLQVADDGTVSIIGDEVSLTTPVYAGENVDTPNGKKWQRDTSAPIGLHLFGTGTGRGAGIKRDGYVVKDPASGQTLRGRLVVKVDARFYPNAE